MSFSSSPLSSPLSSLGSRSPSPPSSSYPSPPSSHGSEKGAATQSREAQHEAPERDDSRPAKRQKTMKSKELKTEYLDLQALGDSNDEAHHKTQDGKLKKLMETLRMKRKIVVIAGAGISVSAGIPDFRSSNGLFATLRSQHKLKASGKHLFDASVYRNDSSTSSFHTMVRELSHLTQNAKPTAFHHMLATLAEEGRLLRLYSQNVDGIDTSLKPLATTIPLNSKGPWPKTIQLHGGLEKMVCSKCGDLSNFDGALFEGPEPPPCKVCEVTDEVRQAGGLRSHGIGRLRPRMVLYNEFNPDEEAIGAVSHADLKSRPDAVIVVGTSLKVPGIRRLAKELCSVTRGRRGGFTAWINHDPEPVGIDFKDCWDMVVRGECDEVARLVSLPKWDDKDCGEYKWVGGKDTASKSTHPEVVLELKPVAAVKTQGILTPTDSPRQQSPVLQEPAKLKQPVLSFGKSVASIPGKEAAPKKKRGRKPLPSGPVKPLGNRITNTYTSTKISKPSVKASKKENNHEFNENKSELDSIKDSQNTPPMHSVSTFDSRTNGGAAPETPKSTVAVEIPVSDRYGTISPPSKPAGLEHLIS